jgi:hypothetical protein
MQREIKSAYRKLSKEFHPDLNSSEDAVEKFIEVDKAYDYLTSFERAPLPQEENTAWQHDPREEWKMRMRRKSREEARARERLINTILRPLNYLFYLVVVFNLLLIVDLLIPKKATEQELIKVVIGMERQKEGFVEIYPYDDVYFTDYFMRVDKNLFPAAEAHHQFTVIASRIFNVPVEAEIRNGGQLRSVTPAVGPYHFWVFLIPLFLVTWSIYRFTGLSNDHRLTLAIFLVIPAILQINVLLRYT